MQIKLDVQTGTSTLEVTFKVQVLSYLRKSPKINDKRIQLILVKLFNRIIFFAQFDMSLDKGIEYEMILLYPCLAATIRSGIKETKIFLFTSKV